MDQIGSDHVNISTSNSRSNRMTDSSPYRARLCVSHPPCHEAKIRLRRLVTDVQSAIGREHVDECRCGVCLIEASSAKIPAVIIPIQGVSDPVLCTSVQHAWRR